MLLRVDVLKKIDPLAAVKNSTTTSAGSTTTLIDTSLAPSAEAEDYVGSWIVFTELVGSGPAIGDIARVTSVDFSGSTSTLTFAPALNSVETGTDYEIHHKVRPSIINDRLDVILGLLRENVLLPVTLAVDGDMEKSGTNDWTPTGTGGTPTLAKNTTSPFVRHGSQALSITNDGATTIGYAKGASINMPPSTLCIVAADVYVTKADSARLTFYDVTGNATIGTAMKSDETGWIHLENLFTTPSTSEQVQVWPESQASLDVTYWDNIVVWPVSDVGLDLPDTLEFLFDVESLFFYPVGTGITGDENVNAYRINEGTPQFYAHLQNQRDDTGVTASRFYVEGKQASHPLWIKGRKPYPVFSSDSDTTQANRYVVTNMTAASIIDDLALEAIEAEKFELARKLGERALLLRFEINHILANMTPPKKKTLTTPFTRE